MSKRKKRPHAKRPQETIVTYYKFVVYFVLITVIGLFVFKISIPIISNTAEVLGVNSLIAKGGENKGQEMREEHRGPDSESEKNEFREEKKENIVEMKQAPGRSLPPSFSGSTDRAGKLEVKNQKEDVEEEQAIEDEIKLASDGGGLVMPKKHLGARIHFPHTIDLATNALIITTPAGTKTVAILPDKAVQNMITKGIISKIGGHVINASGSAAPEDPDDDNASESGGIENEEIVESTTENISLTEESGKLVYKIKGSLKKKLLGLIPVEVEKNVTVSAETGDVESVEEPFFARFLNALSF